MNPRRDSARTSVPLRRSFVRLGVMGAVACGVCALAISLVIEGEDPGPKGVHVRSPIDAPPPPPEVAVVATATRTPVVRLEPRPAPKSAGEVLRQDATITGGELAVWVEDDRLDAQVRYGALRRLEREDPAGAVTAALAVLDDVTPLVRLNAIALLTRSSDPRATAALEKLDDRSRLLAAALVRRGS